MKDISTADTQLKLGEDGDGRQMLHCSTCTEIWLTSYTHLKPLPKHCSVQKKNIHLFNPIEILLF